MLRQRVLTAVVLLVVLAGVLGSQSPFAFALLMAIAVVTAAYETDRLLRGPTSSNAWYLIFLALALSYLCYQVFTRGSPFPESARPMSFGLAPIAVLWLYAAYIALVHPQPFSIPRVYLACIVVASVFSAWFAAMYLHWQGLTVLLAVLFIPIVADTAAYFVGRKFGKRKLAPAISPNKSVEGALGGLAAVTLVHGGWVVAQGWYWWWIAVFVALAAFSIVGDLVESLLKRQAGVKDSSNLLPGHGGVLDRIDAQLPVLPIAALAFHFLPLK